MSISTASSFSALSTGLACLPEAGPAAAASPQMSLEGSRRHESVLSLSQGVTPPSASPARSRDGGHADATKSSHAPTPQAQSLPTTMTTTAIPVVHSTGSLTPSRRFGTPAAAATTLTDCGNAAALINGRAPLAPLQTNAASASPLVTPPLSMLTTPRCDSHGWAGSSKPQLAVFDSIGPTPRADAAPGAVAVPAGDVGTPILGPNKQSDGTRTYATLAEADSDNDEDNSGRDNRRRHHNDDDDSVNYNSFAGPLESSFMSNSSIGGDGSRAYTTLGRATFHIFKGNVGAGVFLLPTYYQDSGYVLGVICVALLGLIMVDCVMALLRSKTRIARAEVRTYPAVVEFVLGYWFRQFTKFALIFTQFGFCIIFVQYASSMFAAMSSATYAYQVCVIVSVLLVTPMTFMSNNMQRLAYVSLLAGVFVAVVLGGTTVIDVQILSTRGIAPAAVAAIPTMRIIVFLSGHMFSLEGIGVVLPVENSVAPEHRVRFTALVRYTLFSIVLLYIVFGVLGYLAYGEALHTSVVLALPPSVFKDVLQVLLGLSLLLGYPIQYVPAIQLVDKSLGVNELQDKKKAYAVRIGLNVLFGVFALSIGSDTINIFASFLGAFVGVHLMITIPTLLALQLEHALSGEKDNMGYGAYLLLIFRGPYSARKVRYFVYLIVAAFVWVAGMYYTVTSVFEGTQSSGQTNTTAANPGDSSDLFTPV